jgi:hypothetical protein
MTTAIDPISHEVIDLILAGQHHDPHAVLGGAAGAEGPLRPGWAPRSGR